MKNKAFNRRLALAGGAAAAAGLGYLALRRPAGSRHHLPEPGTFHRGNAGEPETLDPSLASAVWEDSIIGDLMMGLMVNGPDAQPVPGMAISWTTSTDGLVWTFKLREAQWSDGMPVTAGDFVFSWQRILAPATAAPYAYFLYALKNAKAINAGKMPGSALGARAVNSKTLEVTLDHPAPYILEMIMHMTMYPEPRHVIATRGKDWTKPANYVGNGAYLLKDWVPNDHITLVKNPRFYDAAHVAIEKIIYYPTDDYGAALQRLRAGELDTQDRLPGQQIDWIRANMPELIDPVPQLIVDLVVSNQTRKPFDDRRVRHALNLAINREVITGKIMRTGDVPAYNIVPPNTANFPGGNHLPFKSLPYAQRTAQAQSLMRQAGFGPDNRVRTTYMIRATSAGTYRAVAAALQQMFALIYVDISIIPNDASIFYGKIQEHDFDLAQPGWSADFNDASNFLDLFRTRSGNNWGLYNNPAYDAMLDAAQNDADIISRGMKLARAEAVVLEDDAAMPLFFWVSGNLVRPYMKEWVANNLDIHRTRWISIDEKARAALFSS